MEIVLLLAEDKALDAMREDVQRVIEADNLLSQLLKEETEGRRFKFISKYHYYMHHITTLENARRKKGK